MITKIAVRLKLRKANICFAFLFFFLLFIGAGYCQVADSSELTPTESSTEAPSSTTENEADGSPSVNNILKTTSTSKEEFKKIEEENRWKTIISYIQMIVGFAITIGVAWYLASWARKQELKKEEAKRIRVERALIKKGYTVANTSDGANSSKPTELKPPADKKPIPKRPPGKGRRR